MADASPLKQALERDGALLRLTLARPKANIVDAAMIGALSDALAAHASTRGLRGVLLGAEGPNFSFGASVEEHLAERCAAMLASRSSSAAWRPTSGLAPAPRPLVTLAPRVSCWLAPQFLIACESVFAVMNSTPSTLLLTMCATALPPPPPTPMTLITALGATCSINSKCAMSVPCRCCRCYVIGDW